MKNAINYYYNLNPNEIHQINKIYKFHISNKKYILYPYQRKPEELNQIYELYMYIKSLGIYCHDIILNKDNKIITEINTIQYILLCAYINNRIINVNDIILMANIPITKSNFDKIKRIKWNLLWENKIDYLEYQISQFGKKYEIVRESSDYYIGIVENCISLLSNQKNSKTIPTISHNRIDTTTTTEEFYNPLSFIIDNRIRDISEYIKSKFNNTNEIIKIIHEYVYRCRLNVDEIRLLFIRILYPSKYLDMCELILDNKIKEKELLKLINNSSEFEHTIKSIYDYIKNYGSLPEIEWLTNKN